MFLPDRFVEGTCPRCGFEHANGDQCEECSTVFEARQLVDAKCTSCGEHPQIKESEHLYLSLEQLANRIDPWVKEHEDFWRPHVVAEAQGWLREGLQSRSITRDLDWGVRVPEFDKVFYVWFDAPIGYMSFTKELGEDTFDKFWKNPDSKIYHFLGKDNVPFHTIFWPGMLLANGEYTLPHHVAGLQYLNFNGEKFSKSKGRGVFFYNLLDSDINIDSLSLTLLWFFLKQRILLLVGKDFKLLRIMNL